MPVPMAPPAALLPFARARLEGTLLRVVYRAARGDVTEREVGVLALSFRGGAWIAACHCELRNALRAFRLDRVLEVHEAGPAEPYPGAFDARAFSAGALHEPPNAPSIRVAIRLVPPLAELAPALVPGLSELLADGTVVVHVRTSRPEAAVALALSLGRAAELVHPSELARVAERLRSRAEAVVPTAP